MQPRSTTLGIVSVASLRSRQNSRHPQGAVGRPWSRRCVVSANNQGSPEGHRVCRLELHAEVIASISRALREGFAAAKLCSCKGALRWRDFGSLGLPAERLAVFVEEIGVLARHLGPL